MRTKSVFTAYYKIIAMKEKIAIVCGIYYPDPSPTGLCVKRFVEMLTDKYEISLICISSDGFDEVVYRENITIYRLAGWRMSLENKAAKYLKKILHLAGAVQMKTSLLGNLTWYRKKAYNCLQSINKKNRLNAVFSICSPFAAHCAAMDFKEKFKDIRWCAYTVDPYSSRDRIRPFNYSIDKLIKKEKYVLMKADRLLVSEEIFENRKDLCHGHLYVEKLPYILPSNICSGGERSFFNFKDINCVYAGRFYKDIRNPQHMLKVFYEIKDPKIKLHLFSVGCEDIVNYYSKLNSNIIHHEFVPHSKMSEVFRDSDILISISNNLSEFLPSKIFEYIATGKPIVEFSENQEISKNSILNRYPIALILNENSENSCRQVEDFCNLYSRVELPYTMIEKIYESHSSENIKRILEKAIS